MGERKLTLVFIEHDMDIVFQVANTIRVLCYGRVLAEGTPDEIRNNHAVIDAYLGTEAHADMTDLLRAEGLSAFYGASQILFDVDVALAEKRTLALLGRNGAGKSTTMKMLAGIVPAAPRPHLLCRPRHHATRRRMRARNSASPMCRKTGRCFPSTASRTIC